MKVVWTSKALDTFHQNVAYLEQEWNQTVIETFFEKSDEAILSIEKNPALYPITHKRKKVRRCPVVKQVSLYYRHKEDYIELLTFWNNYQNPKKLKFK